MEAPGLPCGAGRSGGAGRGLGAEPWPHAPRAGAREEPPPGRGRFVIAASWCPAPAAAQPLWLQETRAFLFSQANKKAHLGHIWCLGTILGLTLGPWSLGTLENSLFVNAEF